MSFNDPKIKTAVNIWLFVLDFSGLLTAYEIAAIKYHLWHSISYLSYVNQDLGWFITGAMITVVLWWVYHFHQSHSYWRMFTPDYHRSVASVVAHYRYKRGKRVR